MMTHFFFLLSDIVVSIEMASSEILKGQHGEMEIEAIKTGIYREKLNNKRKSRKAGEADYGI